MTPEELAELRRLHSFSPGREAYALVCDNATTWREDMLRFYDAARNALPLMLDRIDELTAEIERLKQFEAAYKLWDEKTEWVQDKNDWPFPALGMHRADVMRKEIERLNKEVNAMAESQAEWLMAAAKKIERLTSENARLKASLAHAEQEIHILRAREGDE